MCGIAGLAATQEQGLDAVNSMVSRLAHRGPDAAGTSVFSSCFLGHTRLRIVDLRPLADQPLSNEDGAVSVVFNGEIYNFTELRSELLSKGHRFKTDSDSEVLVHLYEEHGSDLLEKLRGMFAFAIWDESKRTLLLARDRLGIKPLYYRSEGSTLRFASEARVLAPAPRKLNPRALAGYLRWGWVPAPETIFEGVRELPPGHLLEWSLGKPTTRRWWRPPHRVSNKRGGGDLRDVLLDSIKRHLVSDVPVGLFLSSGLDSAAISHLAAQAGTALQTYTVGFDSGPDEVAMSAAMAAGLDLPHTALRVTGSEILAGLPQFIKALDQPTVDGLNTWIISRAVKQAGITVALSGLGGDELFAGYSTFRRVPMMQRAGTLAGLASRRARLAAAGLLETKGPYKAARAAQAIAEGGWAASYAAMRAVTGGAELERLWPGAPSGGLGGIDVVPGWDDLDAVTQLELRNYLPYQLLRDTDVMSMSHSLEVRVPLLDDDVVADALRFTFDESGRSGKKKLAAAVSPELLQTAARPKQTFTLPFDRWLRDSLRATAKDALGRLIEPDVGLDAWELSSIWSKFIDGRASWRTVWALTILGLWVDNI